MNPVGMHNQCERAPSQMRTWSLDASASASIPNTVCLYWKFAPSWPPPSYPVLVWLEVVLVVPLVVVSLRLALA
jgi:hypothetical protein